MYKLYKTSFGEQAAMKLNDDGSVTSFMLGLDTEEVKSYLAWVAEGNEPLPAEEQA